MVKSITVVCSWCEEKQHFDGDDPEQESREAGWFQVVDYEDYDPLDFCSVGCAVSWFN